MPKWSAAAPISLYVLDDREPFGRDQIGAPPEPRWLRAPPAAAAATSVQGVSGFVAPIYFEHRVANAGHQLIVCRQRDAKDACLSVGTLGEDHLEQPFLRSPDRRYLFWPFGGAVYDLETLRPLTAAGTIPDTQGSLFDFDIDRPAFTLVNDGRLVAFAAPAGGGDWTRSDDQRASPRFGILSVGADDPPLLAFASVGRRQYLAVRRARAPRCGERWRGLAARDRRPRRDHRRSAQLRAQPRATDGQDRVARIPPRRRLRAVGIARTAADGGSARGPTVGPTGGGTDEGS